MAEGYYSDGVTRITDPFYTCVCQSGHKTWEITKKDVCSECGKKLVICIPANQYSPAKK